MLPYKPPTPPQLPHASFVATMICFGALLAPLLEVKIGLGGEHSAVKITH